MKTIKQLLNEADSLTKLICYCGELAQRTNDYNIALIAWATRETAIKQRQYLIALILATDFHK